SRAPHWPATHDKRRRVDIHPSSRAHTFMTYLSRGNGKLGRRVWHFDLPAGISCPGASEWCALHCYAKRGQFKMPNVRSKYAQNWSAASNLISLETELAAELAELPAGSAVRIHTAGDFFSGPYATMWGRLADGAPATRFYAYTRSWRVA